MSESQLNALHDKLDDGFRATDRSLRAIDSRLTGIEESVSDLRDTLEEFMARFLRPEEIPAVRASKRSRPDDAAEARDG